MSGWLPAKHRKDNLGIKRGSVLISLRIQSNSVKKKKNTSMKCFDYSTVQYLEGSKGEMKNLDLTDTI